jgi:hypothetical protein
MKMSEPNLVLVTGMKGKPDCWVSPGKVMLVVVEAMCVVIAMSVPGLVFKSRAYDTDKEAEDARDSVARQLGGGAWN